MLASPDLAPHGGAPAGERVACEHAGTCGGCPLIELPYPDQLARKRDEVAGAVARYAALRSLGVEAVLPASPIVGYRPRAKLMVAPGGRVGLFAKGGGHEVVDIPGCRVLAPALARVAAVLRASIASAEAGGGPLGPHGAAKPGWLRALDLREASDGGASRVLVTFVVEKSSVTDVARLRAAAEELMRAAPEVAGVAASFHRGTWVLLFSTRARSNGCRSSAASSSESAASSC